MVNQNPSQKEQPPLKTIEYKSAKRYIKKSNTKSLKQVIESLKQNSNEFNIIIIELLKEASKEYDIEIFTYLESQLHHDCDKIAVLVDCLDTSLTHSSDDISTYILINNTCILEQSINNKPVFEKVIDLNMFDVYKSLITHLNKCDDEDKVEYFFDVCSFNRFNFYLFKKLVGCKDNELFKISYKLLISLQKYKNGVNYIKDYYKKSLDMNMNIIDFCFENKNFEILKFLITQKSSPIYTDLISHIDSENNNILHRTASTFYSLPNAYDSISSILSDPSISFPMSSLNNAHLTPSEIYQSLLSAHEELHKKSIERQEADISRIKEIKQLKQYRKSIECDVLISLWLKENNLEKLIEKFGIAKIKSLKNLDENKLLNFLTKEETKMVLNALEVKNKLESIKKRENQNYLKRKKKVKKLLRMYQVDKEEDLPDGVVEYYLNRNSSRNRENRNTYSRDRDGEIVNSDEYEESLIVENSMVGSNSGYASRGNIMRNITRFRNNMDKDGHTKMVTLVIMGYLLFFLMLWIRRMFK